QMTSIAVLWLVRDGVGLTLARYLTMHQQSRTSTRPVIGIMNHSVYASNQAISAIICVAAGWNRTCQSVGWAAMAASAKPAVATPAMPTSLLIAVFISRSGRGRPHGRFTGIPRPWISGRFKPYSL